MPRGYSRASEETESLAEELRGIIKQKARAIEDAGDIEGIYDRAYEKYSCSQKRTAELDEQLWATN